METSLILFLALIFLPLPIGLAIFILTQKSPWQRYLLGLIPIFLFWQIVSFQILRREAQYPCIEFCGFIETLAGCFILLQVFFYTLIGINLRRFNDWLLRIGRLSGRSFNFTLLVKLPLSLGILFLSVLCLLGFYGYILWSFATPDDGTAHLILLGYGNYLLLRQGVVAFMVANVLIVLLAWLLYTRAGKKNSTFTPGT
jgi:hypothetical protein